MHYNYIIKNFNNIYMILPIILIVNLITSFAAAYTYVGETPCAGLASGACTVSAISGIGYCYWET